MSAHDFKGRPLPTQVVVVERGAVANFATAITDANPVFHDPAAAQDTGFSAIPAPPTFNFVMHHWGAFAELQPDQPDVGNPIGEVIATMMADGGMILHGEQAFSYHRPVLVGDRLTGTGEIEDVYVKESGERVMTFVVARTDWVDADDAPVCSARMTLIHRR